VVGYFRRHHLALLALVVAMGGTSYAAVELARNSVGAKQIKAAAVRSGEVKDGSLRARDFKPGQLPAGPAGPSGSAGPTGPSGPSGVVATRAIAGSSFGFNLPGGMGNQEVTLAGCRTPAYTAGPGEVAVINLQATASPSAAINDVLYLKVMASTDSSAFAPVSGVIQANSLNLSTTHVANSHVQTLTPGTAYQWGAGLASNTSVTISSAYCAGNVVIYRSA